MVNVLCKGNAYILHYFCMGECNSLNIFSLTGRPMESKAVHRSTKKLNVVVSSLAQFLAHCYTIYILCTPNNSNIITPDDLNFSKHCSHLANIALARANLILWAFSFSNVQTLCKLYCVYVRPLLEYCSPIWFPHTLEFIDLLENVQRSFTRRLPGLDNLNYPARLTFLNLPSLELCRLRIDCNLMYNIMHNKFYTIPNLFDLRFDIVTSQVITRGHNLKVFVQPSIWNTVKYSFFHRITNVWNALPYSVVNAPNVKLFIENLLDMHLFNYLRGRILIWSV